jgi:phage shock protein PspC (stress-responsive transcriptional regulator)
MDVADAKGQVGKKRGRRLYRDVREKKLGGVASGIAGYMGWDVTVVRLVLVLVVCVQMWLGVEGWLGVVGVYMVLWLIAPEGEPGEPGEMRGEESIGGGVRGEESIGVRWWEVVRGVLVYLLKGVLVLVGILVGLPLAFGLAVVVLALGVVVVVLLGVGVGLLTGEVDIPECCWWW